MQNPNTKQLRQWAQLSLLALSIPLAAHAAPGDFDTSFAGKGWTATEFGSLVDGNNVANSIIQQTDGKLVTAGSDHNGDNDDILLVRYCTAVGTGCAAIGALDTSFGGDGRVTTAIGAGSDVANSLIQQAANKLVVAGASTTATGTTIVLARYNADGALDTSFGNGGTITTSVASGDNNARALIEQADGKLVIAGGGTSANSDVILVRYDANGALDTSFGTGGKVTTPVLGFDEEAYALLEQTNHKLVVAGKTFNGNDFDILLVRYNADGSLDSSFDGDGKLVLSVGIDTSVTPNVGADDNSYGVVQQPDGKLLVTGSTSDGTSSDFITIRFNENGSLDSSFGVSGIAKTAVTAKNDTAYSIKLQSDNSIVVAGSSNNGSNNDFSFVRYLSNGTVDASFGVSGIRTTVIGAGNDVANAMVIQADGKAVAAGFAKNTNNDIAVVRLTTAGAMDTTFDSDGKLATTAGSSQDIGSAIAAQSDGKVITAGFTTVGAAQDFTLARYNNDGSLDNTFGSTSNGKVITSMGAGNDNARAVAIQPDGKIVAAGFLKGTTNDFQIARYTANGVLDTTFNTNGKKTQAVGTGSDVGNAVTVLKVAPNAGFMIVAGTCVGTVAPVGDDFCIARFKNTGVLDNAFGPAATFGKAITQLGTGADSANSIVEQPDGKLVVAGNSTNELGNLDIALVRYNADGKSLDTAFGGAGIVTLDITTGQNDSIQNIIIQPDGKLVATGSTGTAVDFFIARFLPNGSADTSFGTNGVSKTNINGDDFASTVAMQPDGKYIVGGYSASTSGNDATFVRYNSNGTLDTSFGTGGKKQLDTGLRETIRGMAVLPSGKYALAGQSTGPTSQLVIRTQVEDADDDGYGDAYDNCPADANANQLNTDGDAQGNVCDSDDDNDGVADTEDAFPLDASENIDTDSDGIGNNADSDDDNDGALDINDAFPLNASEWEDTDGDGIGNNRDGDIDGDGAVNTVDTEPYNPAVKTEIQLNLNSAHKGSQVQEKETVN